VLTRAHPFRSVVSALTVTALLVTQMPPVRAQQQPSVPAPVTIDECRNLSDPEVRSTLQTITKSALNEQLGQVDYSALVDKHWREARMDERLDREIDEAIRIVRADTTLLDRAYSTISQETAKQTAIAVAERAYGSEGFKAALSDLAQGVGRDFGERLENASQRISGPVIGCVRTALQSRYGGAVAQVFERETEDDLNVAAQVGGPQIETSDLLLQNVGTISGIVLIVSRRIIARMVATIGRRVAGLVASRIISSFTGLIGLALIARDLYQASEGVFPLIEERMKSAEAKNLIKDELAKSMESDLTAQVDTIAEETTERIYAFWQDFQQKYDVLLNLAEKDDAFRAFLKNRKAEEVGRLGRVVSFLLGKEDEEAVLQRARDGTLRRALAVLDDQGVALALELNSLDQAMRWSEMAGARLPKAIDYGLPQAIPPNEITRPQLTTLLALDNAAAAQRIAKVERTAREKLLSLPTRTFQTLARRLNQPELNALATYLTRLDDQAASRVLMEVAADPGLMRTLAGEALQRAVLESRDQLSAVRMLLRDNSALDLGNIQEDFTLVRQGDVEIRVFAQRYWVGLLVAGLLALLFLLTLRRLIFGRPTKVIIKTGNGGGRK